MVILAYFYENSTNNAFKIMHGYMKDIESLNENLEKRVLKEVAKSIKQEKLMQMQARKAQMGEMISMIAHQWRQPLGAIAAVSNGLSFKAQLNTFDLNTKEGQEAQVKLIIETNQRIEGYIDVLINTMDDFRNFYRVDKQVTKTSLKNVVLKSLSIIRSSIQTDNIKLTEEFESEKTLDIFDNEIMQVVLIIIKNAQDNFKESKIENPQIHIKVTNCAVYITDNGGGIHEEVIPKIFDPYFSTKDESTGTGLGLYLSKLIVEDHHNGKIEVVNVDNGVCFCVNLKE